jgi:ABC-type Mn2+/Zn2+ transport system permease subunit
LAMVMCFQVVGTLLVFGLLIAPPAAAVLWANRIPVVMAGAAAFGSAATVLGLLASWHWGTAAGASIAATSVATFFASALVSALHGRIRAASDVGEDDKEIEMVR